MIDIYWYKYIHFNAHCSLGSEAPRTSEARRSANDCRRYAAACHRRSGFASEQVHLISRTN